MHGPHSRALGALALVLPLLTFSACSSGTGPGAEAEVAMVAIDPAFARNAGIDVSPGSVELGIGATVKLVALDGAGKQLRASWSSSAPGVAAVAGNGTVTALAEGFAVVTASTRNGSANAAIHVAAPAVPEPGSCDALPHARRVSVSTSTELEAALAGARPGDLLLLADGVYAGRFSATASGTAEQPVSLCGSRAAVLDGGSTAGGVGFLLRGSHWVLQGFTVTRSMTGVGLRGASHSALRGLRVHATGHEGVHLGWHSSHNLLQGNLIHDTGREVAEYGEAIYVGSFNGHWCARTECAPDRSDANRIVGNTLGPDVRAEHVDVKEGTTGGSIVGNTFVGTGMVQSKDWVDSWVEMKGNGWLVAENRGTSSPRDGFQVFRQIDGWGNGNVFRDNVADVRAGGYGFRVGAGTSGNRVECSNQAHNAGSGLANVRCGG